MTSLGDTLREARELRGITLEDVEKGTHIRVKHLAALEAGEIDALPSPVQARGFLRNYAEYLGLDGDEILSRYDSLPQSGAPPPRAETPAHRSGRARMTLSMPGRSRWFSMDLVVGGVVTVALIGIFVWGGSRLASAVFGTEAATPTVSSFFLPTGSAPTLPLIGGATGTPTAPPPLESFTEVQMRIVVQQRSWVRVSVDGQEAFAGMVIPGQTLEYTGSRVVEILTGNGAGLHVTFNGRDQGPMGSLGQVAHRLWTVEGMITPTPSLAPTPGPTESG